MKRSLIASIFLFIGSMVHSQCTLMPNAIPGLTLTHQNINCYNNSGVAYNPNMGLYYAVRAGNSGFPLETWTATGTPLYNTTAGFDWRGMWWNPITNQLEGNGYYNYGIWRADLDINGYAMNTGSNIFTGQNQPDAQSCGDLDWQAYEIIYYFNGYIYRYSRTTNTLLGSYPITGTPTAISNLNSTSVMYTGCTGMEIALLDYVNKRIYVYDKATGACTGMSQLPTGAVTNNSFMTSWANCYVWLFNLSNYTWYSYKIFDACSSCATVYTSQNYSICSGDSIYIGGSWHNSNGIFYDSLSATSGCDSIIVSSLTVLPPMVTTQNLSICSGSSIFLGGGWQTTNGTYYDTLTSASGCDSVLSSVLSVLPAISTTQNLQLCAGDSVFLGGNWQHSMGTFYDTIITSTGCDSIIISCLTILPVMSTTQNLQICAGDSVFLGGSWQHSNGTYYDTLTSATGCDSIITSSLLVHPDAASAQNISICTGDSVLLAGSFQTTAGTYHDTLSTTFGCDSIITTNLTVLPPVTANQSYSICAGDSILLGGSYQTTAGTYYDTLSTTGGCDSVVISSLTLMAGPVANITGAADICAGGNLFLTATGGTSYHWSNGQNTATIFIAPGSTTYFSVTATNSCGSDYDTVLIHVFALPLADGGFDTIIAAGSSVQLSASGGMIYSWSTGATTPSITVSPSGPEYYSVTITDSNGCSNSETFSVYIEINYAVYVPNVFSPNNDGNNDILYVRGTGIESFRLLVYDKWGEKVFETKDQSVGWDGEFHSKPMDTGVFIYYLTGKFNDEKTFRQKGNVTLVR